MFNTDSISTGYSLYTTNSNDFNSYWTISWGSKAYSSDFKAVIKHMVKELGFEMNEIEFAVEDIIKYQADGAHFGTYKTFIYTFQSDNKKAS